MHPFTLPLLLALILSPTLLSAAELEAIPNCRLIETDWADGDSFRIRTPD